MLLCVDDEGDCEGYGMEVDMWSAGCILYILLSGYAPFSSDNNDELYDSIIEGNYEMSSTAWLLCFYLFGSYSYIVGRESVSGPAKDLIQKMLVTDPEKRIDPNEVLKHPWMTGTSLSVFLFFSCLIPS